jgi:GNAT superfamily N-acetyltransferase
MNNPEYIRMIIYTVDGVQRIVGTYQLIGNDLSSFCILPNYQRRGIATAVLKDILTKVNRISMKGTTEQGCHLYKNFYSYKIGEITYLESI